MQQLKIGINPNSFPVRYRWMVFALLVIGIAVFEFFEHPGFLFENFSLTHPLWTEIILFALLFGAAFMFLELLLRTVSARDRLMRVMEFRDSLVLQLSLAKDWDEFCQRLLEFPRSLVKVQSEYLMVLNEQDQRFLLAASQPVISSGSLQAEEIQETCTKCFQSLSQPDDSLRMCDRSHSLSCPGSYCLMLRYANKVIGILHFCTQDARPLPLETRQILESAGVVIAPVLEAFIQKRERVAAEIADATRAERLAIAQDLHDTLGQNLCYLRLKLDQLSSPGGLRKVGDARQELEVLRDSADESYDLVRGALAILHLENTPQFVDLLRAQGLMVSERGGFEFSLESQGEPKPLSPEVMRHAFYICKEALANVEKHAQAHFVSMCLHWNDIGLAVSIADDGIGFEVDRTRPSGHYGLSIMQKRMQAVKGRLEINSTPGSGTDVNFWLPYSQESIATVENMV